MISARWSMVGGRFVKADAKKCAEEIMSIGEYANPQQVVDKARDESTELHKCFEWDDNIAAEAYRRTQAQWVLRHLVINIPPKDDEPRPEIRFFSRPMQSEGYKPTEYIYRNRDEYSELLAQALRDLKSFREKYKNLTELSDVFGAIDELTA